MMKRSMDEYDSPSQSQFANASMINNLPDSQTEGEFPQQPNSLAVRSTSQMGPTWWNPEFPSSDSITSNCVAQKCSVAYVAADREELVGREKRECTSSASAVPVAKFHPATAESRTNEPNNVPTYVPSNSSRWNSREKQHKTNTYPFADLGNAPAESCGLELSRDHNYAAHRLPVGTEFDGRHRAESLHFQSHQTGDNALGTSGIRKAHRMVGELAASDMAPMLTIKRSETSSEQKEYARRSSHGTAYIDQNIGVFELDADSTDLRPWAWKETRRRTDDEAKAATLAMVYRCRSESAIKTRDEAVRKATRMATLCEKLWQRQQNACYSPGADVHKTRCNPAVDEDKYFTNFVRRGEEEHGSVQFAPENCVEWKFRVETTGAPAHALHLNECKATSSRMQRPATSGYGRSSICRRYSAVSIKGRAHFVRSKSEVSSRRRASASSTLNMETEEDMPVTGVLLEAIARSQIDAFRAMGDAENATREADDAEADLARHSKETTTTDHILFLSPLLCEQRLHLSAFCSPELTQRLWMEKSQLDQIFDDGQDWLYRRAREIVFPQDASRSALHKNRAGDKIEEVCASVQSLCCKNKRRNDSCVGCGLRGALGLDAVNRHHNNGIACTERGTSVFNHKIPGESMSHKHPGSNTKAQQANHNVDSILRTVGVDDVSALQTRVTTTSDGVCGSDGDTIPCDSVMQAYACHAEIKRRTERSCGTEFRGESTVEQSNISKGSVNSCRSGPRVFVDVCGGPGSWSLFLLDNYRRSDPITHQGRGQMDDGCIRPGNSSIHQITQEVVKHMTGRHWGLRSHPTHRNTGRHVEVDTRDSGMNVFGFGLTLKSEKGKRDSRTCQWYPALLAHPRWKALWGEDSTGNVCVLANLLHAQKTIFSFLKHKQGAHNFATCTQRDFTQYQDDSMGVTRGMIPRHTRDHERYAITEEFADPVDGFQEGVTLAVADGGFHLAPQRGRHMENFQELFCSRLLLSEFFFMLLMVQTGGHFILKIFDTFSIFTASLIFCVKVLFEKALLIKPIRSRAVNSERYLVGLHLKSRTSPSFSAIFQSTKFIYCLFDNNAIPDDYSPESMIPPSLFLQDQRFVSSLQRATTYWCTRQTVALRVVLDKFREMRHQSIFFDENVDGSHKKHKDFCNRQRNGTLGGRVVEAARNGISRKGNMPPQFGIAYSSVFNKTRRELRGQGRRPNRTTEEVTLRPKINERWKPSPANEYTQKWEKLQKNGFSFKSSKCEAASNATAAPTSPCIPPLLPLIDEDRLLQQMRYREKDFLGEREEHTKQRQIEEQLLRTQMQEQIDLKAMPKFETTALHDALQSGVGRSRNWGLDVTTSPSGKLGSENVMKCSHNMHRSFYDHTPDGALDTSNRHNGRNAHGHYHENQSKGIVRYNQVKISQNAPKPQEMPPASPMNPRQCGTVDLHSASARLGSPNGRRSPNSGTEMQIVSDIQNAGAEIGQFYERRLLNPRHRIVPVPTDDAADRTCQPRFQGSAIEETTRTTGEQQMLDLRPPSISRTPSHNRPDNGKQQHTFLNQNKSKHSQSVHLSTGIPVEHTADVLEHSLFSFDFEASRSTSARISLRDGQAVPLITTDNEATRLSSTRVAHTYRHDDAVEATKDEGTRRYVDTERRKNDVTGNGSWGSSDVSRRWQQHGVMNTDAYIRQSEPFRMPRGSHGTKHSRRSRLLSTKKEGTRGFRSMMDDDIMDISTWKL